MTPRLTRTVSLAVACLSVGLLSACSSGGPQPGVAALVGDETIRVNEVNRLTDGFCEAARRDFQSRGDVYPMNVLSSVVLQALAMDSIIDQLAEDYDVEPSEAFQQQTADREQSFATLDPDQAEAATPGAGQRALPLRHPDRDRPEGAGGGGRRRAERRRRPRPGHRRPVGVAHVEPARGSTRSTTSRWTPPQAGSVDTTTSHAVTTAAVDAMLADQFAIRELEGDESERFSAYVRSLPATQRCG